MDNVSLPLAGFNSADDEELFKIPDVVKAISAVWKDLVIDEDLVKRLGRRGVVELSDDGYADRLLIAYAKGYPNKPSEAPVLSYLIKKKEVVKLLKFLLSESGVTANESVSFSFADYPEFYPEELDIAFNAWRAVAINGQGVGDTPKKRILDWLDRNYKQLGKDQKDRLSVICNWKKTR